MDLMQCVVDIALVGLVSLTVIGVIAVTVVAAKAAKDGSHGCDLPVDKVEEEDLSPWGMGVCKHCKKSTEVYLSGSEYSQCGQCMWFGPEPDDYGPGY